MYFSLSFHFFAMDVQVIYAHLSPQYILHILYFIVAGEDFMVISPTSLMFSSDQNVTNGDSVCLPNNHQ